MTEGAMRQVLAIDDSRTMREMVSYTLQNAGYAVTEAEDGAAGVSAAELQRFDLVITDLNMPNLDGLGVIRTLRARPEYRGTPILMLTTEADIQKKQEGKAAGATGWIVKPFNPEKLIQVVRQVCPQ
jgi:two-component system, chemotaxis family, chemotaxis protein CheY